MLPFPKRNATDEEVELNDDDLVIVEVGQIGDSEDLAATVQRALPRTLGLPPGSRRVLDGQVEEDVAGLCLASIAEATSRESVRQLSASSHIRAALASAPPPPAPPPAAYFAPAAHVAPSAAPSSMSRLPSVTSPPFVRTSGHASVLASASRAPEAPGVRESAPPPAAFARRSTPAFSVAPVSMPAIGRGHTPEPTVILVRERPRAIWILAAAVCGAFGALAATRLLPAPPSEARSPVVAAAPAAPPVAPLPLPSPVVVAPVSAPAPAPAPAGTVMHFGDDQGVAIKAITPPAPQPARKPAPAVTGGAATTATSRPGPPRAPSMGPALPDGSFGLGRSETASAAVSPPPPPPSLTASAVTQAPEPRRRALTPEQQLAEAQLKASMK